MRRHILMLISLTWITAGTLHAGTFDPTSIAPESGIDVLNRSVARQTVGRSLFADPYATATIGNVDIYDVAPYLEARRFQIVSDPRWNRLVYGEVGKSLHAYDGAGGDFGALAGPRGLAVDEANRVYVADAGNNRVLVFDAVTEFGDISLVPRYAIGGLARPYGVAISDAGTPFVPDDDVLYVADTGHNRIVAYALDMDGARELAALGTLGSGRDCFAGPMAIAAGRTAGVNTNDVYVADAHTQRIVRLTFANGAFRWIDSRSADADIVTALDTDQWGNVYAAAPNRGVVRKYNAALEPIADVRGALTRPRQFYVPFLNVRDHRTGVETRVGQPQGLLVEQWSDASGVRLWNLGLDIGGLSVEGGDAPVARFSITDQARMTLEVRDAASGAVLARRTTDPLAAGPHTLALAPEDLAAAGGASGLTLRLTAASMYPNGPSATATAALDWNGEGAMILPSHPVLLGNSPNPFMPATRIAFVLPAGDHDAALRVFDAQGRVVRRFDRTFSAGLNEVVWDGTDDAGLGVAAGIYFYRLDVDHDALTHKMVLVR